jgi:tetratricopeptide (TPR) repeat protein
MPSYRQPIEEERLYWQGRMSEAEEACIRLLKRDLPPEEAVAAMIVQGMAAFDAGRVSESLNVLSKAALLAEKSSRVVLFASRIALFSRLSQFDAPEDTVGLLADVRQLAHASGTAHAIGTLHLVVARLEAIRGLCVNARRHLEISRRLLASSGPPTQSAIHQIDAGLEAYAGNLQRAKRSASLGLELAQVNALRPIQAGCLTNLGSVLLLSGRLDQAIPLLERASALCQELPVIKFSATDALAQAALSKGNAKECLDHLEGCRSLRVSHHLPSRSWYDLAHQITRGRASAVQGRPHLVALRQGQSACAPRTVRPRRNRTRGRGPRVPPQCGRSAHRARSVKGAVRHAPRPRAHGRHPLRPRPRRV